MLESSYGDLGHLRAPLEGLCRLPIDSRISVQASRNAYEADSFADGVHDRIINAEYVTATLSRRGPWEWTLEVAGAHELHDAWGDKDAVQDHLFNRFVRGYYRF